MSLLLALALAGSQIAAPPEPPPGLLFGFFRMVVFRDRAKELHCASGELDREFEGIRRQLARRYGKKAFTPPEHPPGGPGDCGVVLSVYRVNLADFRRDAEAALRAPAPSPSAAE
jgi:hypothetical protein